MNKTYRLIWNEVLNAWVAVAEIVKARGKRTSKALLIAAPLVAVLPAPTFAQAPPNPPSATALPTGGQVVAGTANIAQSGAVMNITQSTQRAAIDWQTFNVGSSATVNFLQPSSSAVALNRVLSNNPSQIFGQINANGQVFLTNPSGVYFAPGSSVNVGALVATTHSLSNADFMAGNYKFTRNGSTGSVINEGELKVDLGGYIALLAPEVRNQGVVIAQAGAVAMAAGEAVTLQMSSNNTLANIEVEPATIRALVENGHAVQAPGGLVILSARAADQLQGSVVKNSGVLEASSLVERGGKIVLTGDHISLENGSRIDATGATGGGEVLVGGGWQGSGGYYQATTVTMEQGASIEVSATKVGAGGTAVLWSDIHKSNSQTRAYGTIQAKGGAEGGDGGRIETSGRWLSVTGITASTMAPFGKNGVWLLDPADIWISSGSTSGTPFFDNNPGDDVYVAATGSYIRASDISAALANGNVTIQTGDQNVSASNVNIAIEASIIKSAGANDATLTFNSHNDIYFSHIAAGGDLSISSTSGKLNVVFNTDFDGSGARYVNPLTGAATSRTLNITTNGGDLNVNGYIGAIAAGQLPSLNVNAGVGNVTFSKQVGLAHPLDSVSITAANTTFNGGGVTSLGAQTYNTNITLGTVSTTLTQTNANTDFTLQTGRSITNAAGSDASLTIKTTGSITINDGASISSTSNKLNTILWSDTDASDGGFVKLASTSATTTDLIKTNGGHLWIGGSNTNGGSTTWNSLTVGDGFAKGTSTYGTGVYLGSGTVSTSGGNIAVYGQTAATGTSTAQPTGENYHSGIYSINANGNGNGKVASFNAGTGTIYMSGKSVATDGNLATIDGLFFNGVSLTSSATSGDAITLIGDASGADYGSTATRGAGMSLIAWTNQPINISATGGGNIVMQGTSTSQHDANNLNYGVRINAGGSTSSISTTNGGNISITGTTNDTNSPYSVITATTSDSISSSGNLTITGNSKPISLLGPVSVAGTTTLTASGQDITATNTSNDFTGAVSVVSAGNFSLKDANALTMNTVATTGTTNITAAGNLTLTGATTIADDASFISSGADINLLNTITSSTTPNKTLTLAAKGNLNIFGEIKGASSVPLNVILASRAFAGSDTSVLGGIDIEANIRSYGGNITIGGGDTSASDYAIANELFANNGGVHIGSTDRYWNGATFATGSAGYTRTVIVDASGSGNGIANATLPTGSGGGNIVIRGKGSTNLTNVNNGVYLSYGYRDVIGSVVTDGTGSITITGYGGNGKDFWNVGSLGISLEEYSYIKANQGNIVLKGYKGTGYDQYGFGSTQSDKLIGTNSGYLSIEGDAFLIRDGTLTLNAGANSDVKVPIVGCDNAGKGCGTTAGSYGLTKTGSGVLNLSGDAEAWNSARPSNTRATPTVGTFTDASNTVNVVSPVTANKALYAFGTRPATVTEVATSTSPHW